jgi:hypothetical protein
MRKKLTFIAENTEDVQIDDGGAAIILTVTPHSSLTGNNDEDDPHGFFMRLQSWCTCESREHHEYLRSLIGKKIKITVEVLK